jgi:hypothetical protein
MPFSEAKEISETSCLRGGSGKNEGKVLNPRRLADKVKAAYMLPDRCRAAAEGKSCKATVTAR